MNKINQISYQKKEVKAKIFINQPLRDDNKIAGGQRGEIREAN